MAPFILRPLTVLRDPSLATYLYRSLVLGLLGAMALLLAAAGGRGPTAPAAPRDAVVDVSRRAAGDGIVAILGLGLGERVIAIDDASAGTEQVVDAWRGAAPGRYLDLTVADGAGHLRRVLVLVHH